MGISKLQPMRPALDACIDAINDGFDPYVQPYIDAAQQATAQAQAATVLAQTATQAAQAATETAEQASEAATEAAESITDSYIPMLTVGAADGIKSGGPTVDAAFLHRITGGGQASDGPATIEVIRGNTIVQDGELVSVQMEGIESVGWNQLPVIPAYTIYTESVAFDKSKAVHLIGGQSYIYRFDDITNATNWRTLFKFFNEDGSLIEFNSTLNMVDSGLFSSVTLNAQWMNYNLSRKAFVNGSDSTAKVYGFTPTRNIYMMIFFAYGNTTASSVMQNPVVHFNIPARNDEYKPYHKQIRSIDVESYFSNGMRGAGTAADLLYKDRAETHIGVVADMSTLDWLYNPDLAAFYAPISGKAVGNFNITCQKYVTSTSTTVGGMVSGEIRGVVNSENIFVKDSAYTDAVTFKTAMSGVMLYYELATYTTTIIDPPLNLSYLAEQDGTETILVPTGEMSAPVPMVIIYGSTPDGILNRAAALIAAQDGPTATTYHSVGSYLTMNGALYRVTTAIAIGETITPGTNVTATTVMEEVIRLTQ